LTELRAADLRFTPSEAAGFLNQVIKLTLSPEALAALEDRTEGWIAGMQLAALSMRGNQDVTGFFQAFAGDHRYIVDYLIEEVLQRQPEALQRGNFFLIPLDDRRH
jgi:LuxR family maltose regulon positive regulatory protein